MQVMINVPDSLPQERVLGLVKAIELNLAQEAALGFAFEDFGNLSIGRKTAIKEKIDSEAFFENLRNRHIQVSSDVDIDGLMNEMNDGLC